MDANFPQSLKWVLLSEGGWSNNPHDPGKQTMDGVTIGTFRHLINPDATPDDLRHITPAQLDTVYRLSFWSVIRGDVLPSGIDYSVFDFAVNSSPARAVRYLQQAVGALVDGALGPKTLAAVAAADRRHVIDAIAAERLAFLKALPSWPTFGKGWSTRVAEVHARALTL